MSTRAELQKELKSLPALKKQMAKAAADVEKARRQAETGEIPKNRLWYLERQLKDLRERINAISNRNEQELINGCKDEELLSQVRSLQAKRNFQHKMLAEAQSDIDDHDETVHTFLGGNLEDHTGIDLKPGEPWPKDSRASYAKRYDAGGIEFQIELRPDLRGNSGIHVDSLNAELREMFAERHRKCDVLQDAVRPLKAIEQELAELRERRILSPA